MPDSIFINRGCSRVNVCYIGLLAAFLLLFSAPSYGNLGEIQINSHLHEPFAALVPLTTSVGSRVDYANLEVGLADLEKFTGFGIEFNPELGNLRFRIINTVTGRYVQIDSVKPINSPALEILLHYKVENHSFYRQYTVLLNPVGLLPNKELNPKPAGIKNHRVPIANNHAKSVPLGASNSLISKIGIVSPVPESVAAGNKIANHYRIKSEQAVANIPESGTGLHLIANATGNLLNNTSPELLVLDSRSWPAASLIWLFAGLSGLLILIISTLIIYRNKNFFYQLKEHLARKSREASPGIITAKMVTNELTIRGNADDELIASLEKILQINEHRHDVGYKLLELYLINNALDNANQIYNYLHNALEFTHPLRTGINELCHKYGFIPGKIKQ